jgi:putative endonuclease
MPAPDSRQVTGKLGERVACDELERRGYRILTTRHRTRFGEIDIVAVRGGTIVFVEVKARRTGRCGLAAESSPAGKRRRIAALALDYLAWTGRLEARCRFDVVAIDGFGTERQTITVIEDAWTMDG